MDRLCSLADILYKERSKANGLLGAKVIRSEAGLTIKLQDQKDLHYTLIRATPEKWYEGNGELTIHIPAIDHSPTKYQRLLFGVRLWLRIKLTKWGIIV